MSPYMFIVYGAVQVSQDEPIQDDIIHQCNQPHSKLPKQHHMQQVAGTTCQLPACILKETGAMITGILPILPQITSPNKQFHESLNVKCLDIPLSETDNIRYKRGNGMCI